MEPWKFTCWKNFWAEDFFSKHNNFAFKTKKVNILQKITRAIFTLRRFWSNCWIFHRYSAWTVVFCCFFFWVLLKPIHLNQTLFVLLLGVTLIEKGLTLLQLTVWGPPENSLSTFFFLKIRKQNENFQKLHFFFLFKKRAKRKKSQKQCEKILIVTTQRNLELNVLVFRRTTKNNKPKRLRPQMLKNKNKKNFNFFF